ncbi:hypothetical protein FOL47_001772 [Perkinsus chesapeaki]|uniref:Uncharacterized protein n=1 Tax=Perkinsus chesapeaki TaxID=330153 RepID=A0A7J6MHA6_PERCH|nr:hypothetical protein FOL47_001772 [Perkinsus chesapeaki]
MANAESSAQEYRPVHGGYPAPMGSTSLRYGGQVERASNRGGDAEVNSRSDVHMRGDKVLTVARTAKRTLEEVLTISSKASTGSEPKCAKTRGNDVQFYSMDIDHQQLSL